MLKRTNETPFCVAFISLFSGQKTRRYFKTQRDANTFKRNFEKSRVRIVERAKQPVEVVKLDRLEWDKQVNARVVHGLLRADLEGKK